MTNSNLTATMALLLNDNPISHERLLNTIRRRGLIPTLVQEIVLDDALSSISIKQERVDELVETFKKDHGIDSDEKLNSFLSEKQLDEKLLEASITRPEKILLFREERWGQRFNSLYLERKEDYDSVTYHRLECGNTDVMQEVYFRLKDKEETWQSIAQQFANGHTNTTSIVGPVPASSVEVEILEALRASAPGQVCKPIIIHNKTVLVELVKFSSRVIDDDLKTKVLNEEFQRWLDEECAKMVKKVQFLSQA